MSRATDIKMDIQCPGCRRKHSKRLSTLRHGTKLKCVCGQEIKIQGNGFSQVKRELDKLDRSISRLGRTF